MPNPQEFKDLINLEPGIKKAFSDLKAFEKDVTKLLGNIGNVGKQTAKDLSTIGDKLGTLGKKSGKSSQVDELHQLEKSINNAGAAYKKLQETQAGQKASQEALKGSVIAIRKEAKALQAEYDRLATSENRNSKETQELAARIRKLKAEQTDLSKATRRVNNEFTASKGSYNDLTLQTRKLNEELRNLPVNLKKGSVEFGKNERRARELQEQIRKNTNVQKAYDQAIGRSFRNVGNYSSALDGARGSLQGFATQLVGTYLSIQALSQGLRFIKNANVEIEEGLADVRKTTGLTDVEVGKLLKSLKSIDTRTSLQGLLEISKIGGQMGVARQEIDGFTEAIDKANVALGDEFSGGAEEIAGKLGKLVSLFKETRDIEVSEAILRTGSAINELGATTEARSPNIVDFAFRIAELPEAMRPTIQEALALGAAVDKAGIDAERGSRGIAIFLNQAATNVGKFAKQLGISQKAAETLINTDITEFIKQVAESLQGLSATQAAEVLKDLGINASAARGVVSSLSSNIESLNAIMETSNSAFVKNISLIEEFNLKNNTLGAAFEKLDKAFVSLTTGSNKFAGGLQAVVEALTDAIRGMELFFQTTDDKRQDKLNVQLQAYQEIVNGFSTEKIIREYEAYEKIVDDQEEVLKKAGQALEDHKKKIDSINFLDNGASARAYQKELQILQEEYDKQAAALAVFDGKAQLLWESFNKGADEGKESTEEVTEEIEEITTTTDQATQSVDRLLHKIEQLSGFEIGGRVKEQAEFLKKALAETLGDDSFENIKDSAKDFFDEIDKRIKEHAEGYAESEEKKTEALEEQAARRMEIQRAAFQAISEIGNTLFNVGAEKRQEEISQIQQQKAREVELAADNADAKQRIEERYDRQISNLKREQARKDKQAALFNIAINTAAAVVEALPNYVLAAIVGAAGLVQAAIVASKPIPAYEKGTKYAKGGPSIINEKGIEIIEHRGRYSYIEKEGPTLVDMPEGAKVFDAVTSQNMMNQVENTRYIKTIETNRTVASNIERNRPGGHQIREAVNLAISKDSDKIIKGLGDKIKGIPVQVFSLTNGELKKAIRKGLQEIEYKNKRLGR